VRFFIAADCIKQTDHAGLYQIIDFYAGRQLGFHLVRQLFDERRVLTYQMIFVRFSGRCIHV